MSEPKTCEKHVSEKEKQAIMKTIEKTTEKVVSLAMKNGMIISPLNGNADPKKVDDSTNLLDMPLQLLSIPSSVSGAPG